MNSTSHTPTLAFVGGGNMARSLVGGLIARGTPAASLRVSDPSAELRAALARDFSIRCEEDNARAVAGANGVLLAVKPQVMRQVCESLGAHLAADCLVVSIAAGITTGQIEGWLGGSRRVVRAMPNTPALLGCGATGLFANAACGEPERVLAERTLSAVGLCEWIADEGQMDVVTALSGSGPAYAFLLAEAMESAASALGLPAVTARALAAQTLLGAATMLQHGDESPATLRARVTSPGGTTQAAIECLQAGGFEALVRRAIAAATARGAELSRAAGA